MQYRETDRAQKQSSSETQATGVQWGVQVQEVRDGHSLAHETPQLQTIHPQSLKERHS